MIGAVRVSADTLRANARALSECIAPARAAFVVKANAYGHGLAEAARVVEPFASRLCVYSLEEGVALRSAGIRLPVLVMGPIAPADLREAFEKRLEITLWDAGSYCNAVKSVARDRSFRVHAKVDTGAGRFGMRPAGAAARIEGYAAAPELALAGIFSHLASAEDLDLSATQEQLAAFRAALPQGDGASGGRSAPVKHIAASAAALLWPQTRMDIARIGIAVYGLWPSSRVKDALGGTPELRPVLALESVLVDVRDIEAGTAVGYGATFRAREPTRIGIVPLGYADGIPLALSNRGAFCVRGRRCAIAGRVCMNVTMIDLGALPVRAGEPVALIGGDGDAVTVDDWAAWAGTIPYEIVARLSPSLPRVYETAAIASARSSVPS